MKERTYQIEIDGVTITVTKKRMKNMYLRIKNPKPTFRVGLGIFL